MKTPSDRITEIERNTNALMIKALSLKLALSKGEFREEDHPRADDGKFGSGAGSGKKEEDKKEPSGSSDVKPGPSAAETKVREALKVNPYHNTHHIEGEGTIFDIFNTDLVVRDDETAAQAYKRVTGKDLPEGAAKHHQEMLDHRRANDAKIEQTPKKEEAPKPKPKEREIIGYEEVDADGVKVKVPIYKPFSPDEIKEMDARMHEDLRRTRYNEKIHSGELPGNFPYENFK